MGGRSVNALVVSDTHLGARTLDRMPEQVWALADRSDVVLHAGDVIDAAVLSALGERAAVHAVLGNNDHGLRRVLPTVEELDLAGVHVALLHDSGARSGRHERMRRRFPTADVVVFGHSHEPLIERVPDGPLLVNPGSPTQRRRQPVHTVATLELCDGEVRRADIVPVGPFA